MTIGWEMKPLGEVCDVLDHKRKPITKRDRVAGEYPYYGATGVVDYVANYLFDEPLVLVGEDGAKWGPGDNTAFGVSGKVWVNNHAHVLRPNRKVVLDDWLIYYLTHSDLTEFVSGLTVPKLNQGNLREIPIALPPLAEQRRIIEILDEAFERVATAKANAEQNLLNARALFESELNGIFTQQSAGWEEKRLGDVADTQYGLSEAMNEEGIGYKIFRMGEVQGGRLIDTGRMKFAEIDRAKFEKYRLRRGDVLFNRTNSFELVGKTGIFDLEGDYCFASYLVRVLVDPKIVRPTFLNYFMNSEAFQTAVKRKASRSINQANINATILADELIRYPSSVRAQDAILARLDGVSAEARHLESIYQRKVAALDALKASLLREAFAGNL